MAASGASSQCQAVVTVWCCPSIILYTLKAANQNTISFIESSSNWLQTGYKQHIDYHSVNPDR